MDDEETKDAQTADMNITAKPVRALAHIAVLLAAGVVTSFLGSAGDCGRLADGVERVIFIYFKI